MTYYSNKFATKGAFKKINGTQGGGKQRFLSVSRFILVSVLSFRIKIMLGINLKKKELSVNSLMFDEGNILVEMSCDRIRFVNISISEHLNYFSVQQNIFQNSGCLVGLDIRLFLTHYYISKFEKN